MKAIIKLNKNSPHPKKVIEVDQLREVHFNFKSRLRRKQIAFESQASGFTIEARYVKEFEVFA